MSRRYTRLVPGSRDGTSQRARALGALDPAHAPIDERTSADLIAFAQAYAEKVRFVAVDPETGEAGPRGTWSGLAHHPDVSLADLVAYLANPEAVAGERARWLGRPHLALLLAFVELLGQARDHLNGFTRRHLDHYYRELLQMKPQAPVADHAVVIAQLAPSAVEARLPAGTELGAGRDPGGVPRVYRTEREIVVNRAAVASLSSLFVDRRSTGIPDVRKDRALTAPAALTRMLAIALGVPNPGDPVPRFDGKDVDHGFLATQLGFLGFAWSGLFLEQDELRSLMRLYRRRSGPDGDAEWAQINGLLGVSNPVDPRDFRTNLESRVGKLDFAADGLPQVGSVDDLYTHRTEPDVRAYIDARLGVIGFETFVAAMQIKLRIDAEWSEINRLLERIGRRQRGLLTWSLPPGSPTDFAANLAAALQGRWPPAWPAGTKGIDDYEALLRRLELHLSMPVERLQTLVAFAGEVSGDPASEHHDFSEVDRILADAHRDQVRAARRARLDGIRAGRSTGQAFDDVVSFVLGARSTLPWDEAKQELAPHLSAAELDLLDRFRAGLGPPHTPVVGFGWPDAEALLELAWRDVEGQPEPVARQVVVNNAYAYADATQVVEGTSPGWRPFGQPPRAVNDREPRGATLGWALRSPALSLSEGARTITLTLGLRADGFDLPTFLAALAGFARAQPGDPLAATLQKALALEVSTAKGWVAVPLTAAQLVSGKPGEGSYWTLIGAAQPADQVRPALQIRLVVDPSRDPLAPLKGDSQPWPALRLTLRPRWDGDAKEWRTAIEPFQPLVLVAVNLKVHVEGLTALRLQQDDRPLDPRKPFELFGSRPAVGARFYLHHPELVRPRLGLLRFDVEWMGLPTTTLGAYYFNYPNPAGTTALVTADFKSAVVLVDRGVELRLADVSLFEDDAAGGKTRPTRSLSLADVGAAIAASSPTFVYASRNDLSRAEDVRLAERYLRWELTPVDFGHPAHASLAATKARELAVGMASGSVKDPTAAAGYRVEPPYTPTIKRLAVAYETSLELDPAAPAGDHQILHVHPFGVCPIDATLPALIPRYPLAGELYIGLRGVRPPQRVSLLLQLAEGTSNPDVEPAPVSWSYLTADRFEDLPGGVVQDSTRGLINSGIVELGLPAPAPSTRLPPDLYWLRLSVPRSPGGVCDVVDLRAQAVAVRFDDRGNDPRHYEQPLPAGAITHLIQPDGRIAAIVQPYTSVRGKPGEEGATFDTRVSERLRHKQRALSPWDYERLVLQRFGQIYKAKCLSTPDGVDVVVIPDIRAVVPSDTFAPRAPANLLADIQAYLAERAPAAARVRVRNAQYVAVQVRLGVRFLPGQDEGYARRTLNADLVRHLSPWAFDDAADLMIGGRIYASSIVDFVDRRDYVDFVAEIELFRSLDGQDFDLVPPAEDYNAATTAPDQVLVAAPQHYFDIVPDTGYQQASFSGIGYARIELDFIVA